MHFVQRSTLFVLAIMMQQCAFAQLPPTEKDYHAVKHISSMRIQKRTQTAEICGNNVDDDQNGLADSNDFSCYYKDLTPGCKKSNVIWTGSSTGLQWANPDTGEKGTLGPSIDFPIMNDITWTKNGELYGIGWLYDSLYKFDPYTWETTAVSNLPGYNFANGMTSDHEGNLIMVGTTAPPRQWHIFKYDLTSHQTSLLVDLTPYNLESAGDLVFFNGFLYLACNYGKMAKINLKTRTVEVIMLANHPSGEPMGMITLGDGYLYIAVTTYIYRIDPTTMTADTEPFYTFEPNNYMMGLANYTEFCNAPACNGVLDISIESPMPYCSEPGILLKANLSNMMGEPAFEWSRPGPGMVTSDTVRAYEDGLYRIAIKSSVADCIVKDSIEVTLIKTPSLSLGKDTVICNNLPVTLQPDNVDDITNLTWNNGSTATTLNVALPGTYWIRASNSCGTARDTILVSEGLKPQANLGQDLLICPGTSGVVKNLASKTSFDEYTWSDNSFSDSIVVVPPNTYWLENKNSCGVARDSLTIGFKDSCTCFPFYPAADLGQNRVICLFDSATLFNYSHRDGFRYSWSNNSTAERITAQTPGVYRVSVSTYCGTVQDSVEIFVKTDGCIRKIYVPTAFSPNTDLLNDQLKPIVFGAESLLAFEFSVFNRYGQKIFSSTDPKQGWNGTFNDRPQNTGIFTWQCSYQFSGMAKQHEKGIATLLR